MKTSTGSLWRSIRHTPARQLLHRAALMAKRHTLVAAARHVPSLAKPPSRATPDLREDPPVPDTHPPHGQVRIRDGRYSFRFLNVEREFTLPLDWHRNDLNVGTRLWKLHLHYFDYAHALPDIAFRELVDDWIRQNRPYRPGYWLDSWNSYAMSIRLVAWIEEYLRRRDRMDAGFLATLRASIHEQFGFLEANIEKDIGGNHLIKNIKALYWGSRFFAGPDSERYAATADRLLARELPVQILADGFHFELSPAYHCQVFGDLLDCWHLMRDGELRGDLAAKLKLMAQVVADLTHPDGAISLFNDGGLSMASPGGILLDRYAGLMGERPQPCRFARFPQAGYHIMRTDEFYLVCDAGRVGPDGLPAHAHGDIFAFELTVRGQRMIVDCGVFEYNAGAKRSLCRSTAAHNTLTLDDEDQCEFWSAFRLGRRANVTVNVSNGSDDALVVDAEHDGYAHMAGGPVHRRRIQAEPEGRLSVRDMVKGGAGQHAVSRLLLHPSVEIVPKGDDRLVLRSGESRIELDAGGARVSTRPAPWWPDFGHEIKTTQIVLDYGPVPGDWEYRIAITGD